MDLSRLLAPRSVALVGASANRSIFRGRLTDALLDYGYGGTVYLVSPSCKEIRGVQCLSSIEQIGGSVDLAILAIPSTAVLEVLEYCGRQGFGAALIVSSGFSDEGTAAGREGERRIREISKQYFMPVMGPNSQGFLNAALPLSASFSGVIIDGSDHSLQANTSLGQPVCMIAQSGGIGFAIYDKGRDLALPYASVIAVGNQAVLEVVDFLEYALADDKVGVIQLFIEGIGHAGRFESALAAALKAGKPIIATKIGRSEVGAQASASHTGSLAGSAKAFDAVFRHYGVQRADTEEELLGYTACFSYWNRALPKGRRVAILTPSGGAGIWLSDVCEEHGLDVVELDAPTRALMDDMQPVYASSRNPVDVTAQGLIENGYARPLELLANSSSVDAIIVACTTSRTELLERDYQLLKALRRRLAKPVVFCSYTKPNIEFTRMLAELGFPCLSDMHSTAKSILAMSNYEAKVRAGQSRLAGDRAHTRTDSYKISDGHTDATLCEYQAKQLLRSLGFPLPIGRLATTGEEAEAALAEIGHPVVMKVQSAQIPHKSDAGGVRLSLADGESVKKAFAEILLNATNFSPRAEIDGVLVEPMADRGVEIIIGINRDDDFGPMIMVGLGGIYVEIFGDVAFSPVPVDCAQAHEMLSSLQCVALLDGYRGEPRSDIDALCRLLVQLSQFADQNRDLIREVDLNPVLVHPMGEGVTIVDALIVLEQGGAD
jgi:acetate---CoA ligase (ADP-forming)